MFLTACVAPTPKKNASKKSNQMVYLEKLDTADANKRILEYRKKEEAENPDEQFMDSASYCEYTDSMGYVVYIGKNDDGYLKTKRRKESLFGENMMRRVTCLKKLIWINLIRSTLGRTSCSLQRNVT